MCPLYAVRLRASGALDGRRTPAARDLDGVLTRAEAAGRSARRADGRTAIERRAGYSAGSDDHRQVDPQLERRAAALLPVPVGGGDPDVGGRRDRRHRDQARRSALPTLRSTATASPRSPARKATRTEYVSGCEMKNVCDLSPSSSAAGVRSKARRTAVRMYEAAIATTNPATSATRGAPRDRRPAADDRDAQRRQRPELGADDHGADDQDRGVGEDPDRGEERRDDHEREVAEREIRALADLLLDLLPEDGVRRRAGSLAHRAARTFGERRVDARDRDRSVPVEPEGAQAPRRRRSLPRVPRRRRRRRRPARPRHREGG